MNVDKGSGPKTGRQKGLDMGPYTCSICSEFLPYAKPNDDNCRRDMDLIWCELLDLLLLAG